MSLTVGEMLQERYRIASLLGQGGMGTVYRAWDTRLNVPVAIKELNPQPGLDPNALAQLRRQFQQEAKVLARLDHPNLVRVMDFFSQHGSEYIVMNRIEGESLDKLIEKRGAFVEAQVLAWAEQLLNALAYCHSQGVIHRDVKPQNVIIRPDGQAVLVDFGLVKLWDPNDPRTKTSMRGMGTPEYAPPEQYDTDIGHTDAQSDLYSLGATMYHALTGQAPPTATQRMSSPEKFVPLQKVVPGVSGWTEAAILKAMELARSQRWSSATAMAKALRVPNPKHSDKSKRGKMTAISGTHRHVSLLLGVLGGLTVLLVAVGVLMGLRSAGNHSTPTPVTEATATMSEMLKETDTPFLQATSTLMPTSADAATSTSLPSKMPMLPAVSTSTMSPPTGATSTIHPLITPAATPTHATIASATPTPRRLVAPILLEPANGTVFQGWNAEVYFHWSEAGKLSADEYYVLIISHQAGEHRIWLKDTLYHIEEERWLSEYGPDLQWKVGVACKRTSDPHEDPRGAETSAYSTSGSFSWYPSAKPAPPTLPPSTQTAVPITSLPPRVLAGLSLMLIGGALHRLGEQLRRR